MTDGLLTSFRSSLFFPCMYDCVQSKGRLVNLRTAYFPGGPDPSKDYTRLYPRQRGKRKGFLTNLGKRERFLDSSWEEKGFLTNLGREKGFLTNLGKRNVS